MRGVVRMALLAAALIAGSRISDAADVRILAVRAAEPVVRTLAPQFKNDFGDEIELTVGTSEEVMEKIKAGEIFDALIASESAMDALDGEGLVNPESRVRLATGTAVGAEATPSGQADPPVSKIVYEGAVMSDGALPEAARSFILFLASSDARSAWIAANLEPAP